MKELKLKETHKLAKVGGVVKEGDKSKVVKLAEGTPEELKQIYNYKAKKADGAGKLTIEYYPYRHFFEGDQSDLEQTTAAPAIAAGDTKKN